MAARPLARIYRGTSRNLAFLAACLRKGELVAVPSETVYGLAGNALDARACREIFRAKRRPANDPLIVHIHSLAQLKQVCRPNPAALLLAKRFWPGPLTLVLPKTDAIPAAVSAGQASVAVRMPSHPLFRKLLKLTGVPLAAPSANPFGYVSPTTASHVRDGLGFRIRHILDGKASAIGLESTILDLRRADRPRLLRPGAVTREAIEEVLQCPVSRVRRRATPSGERSGAQLAPGMMMRHYSPQTPVELHDTLRATRGTEDAYIFIRRPDALRAANVFWLDPSGKLEGVAHRLFAVLRQVDRKKFRTIHVELARGSGLAEAINDRLRRAASR